MLLLFAGGVMNLVWIAGLAGLVLVEKLTPWGTAVSRWSALALGAAGTSCSSPREAFERDAYALSRV